jgi:hypothetical protein
MVFALIWPGLDPTIYRTRGEHASHYTTDAALCYIDIEALTPLKKY